MVRDHTRECHFSMNWFRLYIYGHVFLEGAMADPRYQSDVSGLAAALQREHGLRALDVALETTRRHIQDAAWKHCTLWLQIVNHLNTAQGARTG